MTEVESGFGIYLTYSAGEGGRIEGEASQKIEKGEDGSEVRAVADSGYAFVKWSDGETSETRSETNATASDSYTAEFQQLQFDEELADGYYVISTYNSVHTNGCNSDGLPEANEKCILGIDNDSDNNIDMYVAPGSTDVDNVNTRDKGETTAPTNDGADLYYNGAITDNALENGDYGYAAKHCANLTGGGLDWKLPPMGNTNDMSTDLTLEDGLGNGGLVDIFVAYDNGLLTGGDSDRYWSSKFDHYGVSNASWWKRHLGNGVAGVDWRGGAHGGFRVRCIAK